MYSLFQSCFQLNTFFSSFHYPLLSCSIFFYRQFYSMVTGGKKAPSNMGAEARGGAAGGRSTVPPPPSGQNVVQARNAKKQALEEFAKENNLKPESVKKAYKRFQASDRFVLYLSFLSSLYCSTLSHCYHHYCLHYCCYQHHLNEIFIASSLASSSPPPSHPHALPLTGTNLDSWTIPSSAK